MNTGDSFRAVLEGLTSMVRALTGWNENPVTATVLRRLWGPLPLASLAAVAAAGAAAERWLPVFDRLAGVFPPLSFLFFFPDTVVRFFWSGAALVGALGALRIRTLRTDPDELDLRTTAGSRPGALVFEAAVVPLGLVALIASLLSLVPTSLATEAFPSTTTAFQSIISFLMAAAVTGGVLVSRRQLGTAFGQLLGAGFSIWGIHLGISFAAPWMMSWWEWILGLGGGSPRSPAFALMAFDVAVVAVAWVVVRGRFAEGIAWRPESTNNSQ